MGSPQRHTVTAAPRSRTPKCRARWSRWFGYWHEHTQTRTAVQASCDASADVYFNKKGHYDQDKEAWRMRCYEKMGDGIIKPEDKSAP